MNVWGDYGDKLWASGAAGQPPAPHLFALFITQPTPGRGWGLGSPVPDTLVQS